MLNTIRKIACFLLLTMFIYVARSQQNITVSPTSVSATFNPNPSGSQSITVTKTAASAVFPFGNYNLVYQSNIGSFTASGGACLSSGGCNSVTFSSTSSSIINSLRTCPSSGTVRMTGAANTNTTAFSVVATAPTLTSVSATSSVGGGPAEFMQDYNIVINGSNFRSHSTCAISKIEVGTSTINPTWVNILSPATVINTTGAGTHSINIGGSSLLSSQIGFGTKPVRVTTPGGISNVLNITVNQPPSINSVSPNNTPTNTSPVIVTVNGNGFTPSTAFVQIRSGGALISTILNSSLISVSATSLSFNLPNTVLANPNGYTVTVRNFSTGADPNSIPFTVFSLPPTIASASVVSQTAATLSIFGTNYYNTSSTNRTTVSFNGSLIVPTNITSNSITLNNPSSLINSATSPVANIQVTNPTINSLGGGTASFSVTITYGIPTISGISTSAVPVGNGNLPFSISGTNLAATSVVTFDGVAITPVNYSTSTGQLSLTIPASLFTTAKIATIAVTNPSTGGGGGTATTTFRVGTFVSNVTNLATGLPTMQTFTPSVTPLPTIVVTGAAFTTSSVIYVNGIDLNTTFVSSTSLRAVLDPTLDNSPSRFLLEQQMQQRGALRINVKNGSYVSNTHAFPIFELGDGQVFNRGTASMRFLEYPFPGNSVIGVTFEGVDAGVTVEPWIALNPPPDAIRVLTGFIGPVVTSWNGFFNMLPGGGQTTLSPIGTLPGGEFLFQIPPYTYSFPSTILGTERPWSIEGFYLDGGLLRNTWPGMFSF